MLRRQFLGVLVSSVVLGVTALPALADGKKTPCVWCSGTGNCQQCGGTGGWPKKCNHCGGSGQCPACQGKGHN